MGDKSDCLSVCVTNSQLWPDIRMINFPIHYVKISKTADEPLSPPPKKKILNTHITNSMSYTRQSLTISTFKLTCIKF